MAGIVLRGALNASVATIPRQIRFDLSLGTYTDSIDKTPAPAAALAAAAARIATAATSAAASTPEATASYGSPPVHERFAPTLAASGLTPTVREHAAAAVPVARTCVAAPAACAPTFALVLRTAQGQPGAADIGERRVRTVRVRVRAPGAAPAASDDKHVILRTQARGWWLCNHAKTTPHAGDTI